MLLMLEMDDGLLQQSLPLHDFTCMLYNFEINYLSIYLSYLVLMHVAGPAMVDAYILMYWGRSSM